MSISLNNHELEALRGLPHSVIVLYVMGIRPRMDYRSGLVGVKSGISWQALSEDTYIEPHPGIQSGSLHKSALRRAADALERAGLILNKSKKDAKQLIFKCLLAYTDKNAQNKPDTNPTHQADTLSEADKVFLDSQLMQDVRGQADIPETPQADIHPVSGTQVVYVQQQQRAAENKKDCPDTGSQARPGAEQHKSDSPDKAAQARPGAEPHVQLIFPPGLHDIQQAAITKILRTAQEPQTILDELAGRFMKGTIGNPVGYVKKLVLQEEAGQFTPELAYLAFEARNRASERQKRLQESEAQHLQEVRRTIGGRPADGKERMKSVKEFLKGSRQQ